MSKFLFSLLLISLIIGCSLDSYTREYEEIEEELPLHRGVYHTPNGCEYYIYDNGHGGIPIHKEDCEACKERNKL